MFTLEEMKAMEVSAQNVEVTVSNEACDVMSSGCTWG